MNVTRSTPKSVELVHSIPAFDFPLGRISNWNDQSGAKSHFWNSVSCLLPNLETYVIKFTGDVIADVPDPALKEDIRTFCKQEATHASTHDAFNKQIESQYRGLKSISKIERGLLKLISKVLPKKYCLSIFVFVEHLTAIMGHRGLENPDNWFKNSDQALYDMWQWHALEEVAHKAVCFDAHKAIGGGYFSRLLGFLIGFFVLLMPFLFTRYLLLGLQSPKRLSFFASMPCVLFGRNGVFSLVLVDFFHYFKWHYHPWQLDSKEVIDRYSKEYLSITQDHIGSLVPRSSMSDQSVLYPGS